MKPITNDRKTGRGERAPGQLAGTILCTLIVIAAFTLAVAAVGGVTFVYRLYETLPTHSKLQNIEQSVVSKVYDKDGNRVHEFSVERRFWVSLDKIPIELQNAVLAIEDRKFYTHWGIDVQRNIGAIVVNLTRGRRAQGASTITQQLARNLYLTADKSFIRKVREMLTAVQLERTYTKREILELYLNQVYLGAGMYGVQAAAQHYFSKDVSDLTLAECVVVAGVIQLPERHRPDREENMERITTRRNNVVRAMVTTNAIGQSAADAIINAPIEPNPKVYPPARAPYFMEAVRKYVADKYGDNLLYNGGLVIYTTLDLDAQEAAENSVSKHIVPLQRRLNRMYLESSSADRKMNIPRDKFLSNFDSLYALYTQSVGQGDTTRPRRSQQAVVSLDVATGAVRVMVGGRDFQESRFNRALQARRQAGSSFKSYVYAAAMENGFSPATIVFDQPITELEDGTVWRPANYDRSFSGSMSVRQALAKSNNLIAIQVFEQVGGQTVVDYAQKIGIKQTLHTSPSLALGACEVTPIEMVAAHAVFASGGVYAEPFWVRKIVDRNGRVLEDNAPNTRQATTPQIAFLMNSMLSTVVCCGTAASIRGLGFRRTAAGKTGTTDEYSDAWFVGYTPQLATVVWAGTDERRSMGHGVTGSVGGIPVWTDVMIEMHKNLPVKEFERPAGIRSESVCAQSGGRALPACPEKKGEFFLAGAELANCRTHAARDLVEGNVDDIFGPGRRSSNQPRAGDSKGKKGKSDEPPPRPRKRSTMF